MNGGVAPWQDALTATPALAAAVQARFEATGLGLLATLRRDGSPRITGVEPGFALGELWLGMMDGATRSPRATIGAEPSWGTCGARAGAPDGPFHLFRVDVTELVMLRPSTDHLVIESWHEGQTGSPDRTAVAGAVSGRSAAPPGRGRRGRRPARRPRAAPPGPGGRASRRARGR